MAVIEESDGTVHDYEGENPPRPDTEIPLMAGRSLVGAIAIDDSALRRAVDFLVSCAVPTAASLDTHVKQQVSEQWPCKRNRTTGMRLLVRDEDQRDDGGRCHGNQNNRGLLVVIRLGRLRLRRQCAIRPDVRHPLDCCNAGAQESRRIAVAGENCRRERHRYQEHQGRWERDSQPTHAVSI